MPTQTEPFLEDFELRKIAWQHDGDICPIGLALGLEPHALEVMVTSCAHRPAVPAVAGAWRYRLGSRAVPLVLVVLYEQGAAICAPWGEVYSDLSRSKVERTCAAALREPDRHRALQFLREAIPALDSKTSGLRNEGLFALHELEYGVPRRNDWQPSGQASQPLLNLRAKELLQGLGYTLEQLPSREYVLRSQQSRLALGLLLNRDESLDPGPVFSQASPISKALAIADAENLDYLVVTSGPRIRLYPVQTGVGTGQRGRTETFAEINLDLLAGDNAAYLWLLFSAEALTRQGSVKEILESSTRYAVELGTRLRERIYNEVVPTLAKALLEARNIRRYTPEKLRETYQVALVVLFRLLFIAYAEDKELLPWKTNDLYRARSLKQKAIDLTQQRKDGKNFSVETTSHWEEVERLFRAVDKGHAEWGVPAYNGGLFTSEGAVSAIGAVIAGVKLRDEDFGPILSSLLVDRTENGWGPVDFRSLGVREFGTIYEGLLENELSIAETDLAVELRDGKFRPAKPKDQVQVGRGQAFLHNTSGARKSTGSYFTKDFAVEHLLEKGLEPALQEHTARLDALANDRDAADAFFDFRVADITMGSGHFLIAALDRIERSLSSYLSKRRLPDVVDELSRLREVALKAMRKASGRAEDDLTGDVEVDEAQLLRRQIARHCVYGVDLNPIAVELARLGMWIHTFVPGLPLSFLDHNLVAGNSLVGIATLEEATEETRELLDLPLWQAQAANLLGPAEAALARLARLSDADASEIAAARRASADARAAVAPAAALLDVLTAARISEELKQEFAQRGTFWIENLDEVSESRAHKLARKTLAQLPPFHFPIAFPEVFLRERPGFDVIVGNPPWEEATVEEDRFWTRHNPGFHSLSASERKRQTTKLREGRPDLVKELDAELEQAKLLRSLLVNSPYPGMGTGDPDVYKAASWRFWNLVRTSGGRISVVLPRSALSARGSEDFRREILQHGQLSDIVSVLNRGGWVFDDAEPRYTIVLVSILKLSPNEETTIPLLGPFSSLDRFEAGVKRAPARFLVNDLLSWTDSASFPLLPSESSAEVFAQLRKAPRLDLDDNTTWRAMPHAELHATNDKPLMRLVDNQPDGTWPIFQGRSFDLWAPDTGEYYAWGNPKKILPALNKKRLNSSKLERSAFYGMSKADLKDESTLPSMAARIAFRDVTRSTDTRTVRAALLPPEVFITNTAPYLVWRRGDERDQSYLLGLLSSLVLDWYARRFVEIHVNYHVFNPFPIPRPSRKSKLWQAAVGLAGRLACPDKRFKKWAAAVGVNCGPLAEEDKQDKIHELDAVVAHVYGLSELQLRHIFETFHEGWDCAGQMEATLVHFRRWQTKLA